MLTRTPDLQRCLNKCKLQPVMMIDKLMTENEMKQNCIQTELPSMIFQRIVKLERVKEFPFHINNNSPVHYL